MAVPTAWTRDRGDGYSVGQKTPARTEPFRERIGGPLQKRTTGTAIQQHREAGVALYIDMEDFERLGATLDKMAQQLAGPVAPKQMRDYWKAIGSDVQTEAAGRAPRSGRTGKTQWSKGSYTYPGKRGIFKTKTAVKVKPWRNGMGVWFNLGGGKSKFGPYINVVGKFATFNVRRKASGTVKLEARPWLIDAINAVGPKAGKGYVKLLQKAMETEIQRGQRK